MGINLARYQINSQCNGVEIYFLLKPSDAILHELKLSKWRWYKSKGCWYTFNSAEHRTQARRICDSCNSRYEVASYDMPYAYGKSNDMELWESESIMKKNGYTVSQEEGLRARERQRILDQMIINGVLTPKQVVRRIETQIMLKEKTGKYDLACKKWREDIAFIKNNYG